MAFLHCRHQLRRFFALSLGAAAVGCLGQMLWDSPRAWPAVAAGGRRGTAAGGCTDSAPSSHVRRYVAAATGSCMIFMLSRPPLNLALVAPSSLLYAPVMTMAARPSNPMPAGVSPAVPRAGRADGTHCDHRRHRQRRIGPGASRRHRPGGRRGSRHRRGGGGGRGRARRRRSSPPTSPWTISSRCSSADAVVHLAWQLQPAHRHRELERTNILGTRRVLEAAGRAGVGRVLAASSVGAYARAPSDRMVDEAWPVTGVPTSTYSRQKAELERLCDAAVRKGLRVIRMRPALIFQSFGHVAAPPVRGPPAASGRHAAAALARPARGGRVCNSRRFTPTTWRRPTGSPSMRTSTARSTSQPGPLISADVPRPAPGSADGQGAGARSATAARRRFPRSAGCRASQGGSTSHWRRL